MEQRALCMRLLQLQLYRNEVGLATGPLRGGGSVELGDKEGLNAVTSRSGLQRHLNDWETAIGADIRANFDLMLCKSSPQ